MPLFGKPVSWKEALKSRQLKKAMPTSLSSDELAALPRDVTERAMFSARTTNASYLQDVNDLITRIVDPDFVQDPATGERRERQPGEYTNEATARLEMKTLLKKFSYQPSPEDRGTLKDLSSESRLNLIIKTNTEMAQGHGRWLADQDPDRLDVMPAQELYRLESREKPRDWVNRWLGAGGQIYGGRMVALKNDPIWTAISAFGLPYPPFDFNSGMWVQDVSREEAEDLGLLEPGAAAPAPADTLGFNDDLQASAGDFAEPLQKALMDSLGNDYEMVDGVLQRK